MKYIKKPMLANKRKPPLENSKYIKTTYINKANHIEDFNSLEGPLRIL